MRVAIVGVGAFGFALAHHLDRTHGSDLDVCLTDADSSLLETLAEGNPHPRLDGTVFLPRTATLCCDAAGALAGADLMILAVPGRVVAAAANDISQLAPESLPLLNVAKALDLDRVCRLGEVVATARGPAAPYAAMAGGMIANELVAGHPLGATIGGEHSEIVERFAELLRGPGLVVETTTDVAGVELASAFKNVLSIGSGLLEGLGYHLGTRSFYLARATGEIQRLAPSIGAAPETFAMTSQCWGNDLVLSSLGNTRNRAFGEALATELRELAKGDDTGAPSPEEVSRAAERIRDRIEAARGTVEGYYTAVVLIELLAGASEYPTRLMAIGAMLRGESTLGQTVEALLF